MFPAYSWIRRVLLAALLALGAAALEAEVSQFMQEQVGLVAQADRYFESGNYAEAASYYHQGFAVTSKTRGLMFRYAYSLTKSGNDDSAESIYEKVLHDNPMQPLWDKAGGDRNSLIAEANIQLGFIHERRGSWDLALSSFQRARSNTSDWRASYLVAVLLLERKSDPNQAIDYAHEALRRAPDSEPARKLLANCYNTLGVQFDNAGDLDGAIGNFKKALEYRPGWALAQENIDKMTARKVIAGIDAAVAAQRAADAQRSAAAQPAGPVRPPVPDLPAELVERFIETLRRSFSPDEVAAMLKEEPRLALVRDEFSERTTLHMARTSEIAQLLLDAGADPKIKSESGGGAIFGAVAQETPDVAKLLLKHGASLAEKDGAGRTLLHEAVLMFTGPTETTEWVIANSAQIDSPDDRGFTPLMLAVESVWPDLVELLLAHGADLSIKDKNDKTAADHAAESGHPEFESKLRSLAAISPKPRDYLVAAVGSGDIEALRSVFAIAPGLVETSGPKDQRLINLAARAGRDEVIELLIKSGAGPDHRDSFGETALEIAAKAGTASTIRLLTAAGADARARDPYGYSALDHALMGSCAECVAALIEAGADVNGVSRGGSVPLVFAVANGSTAMIRLLLESGANANVPEGTTAPLCLADAKCAAILIEAGADVNARDSDATPLIYAAMRNEGETVKLLIDHGADINAVDSKGRCALHVTNLECSQILVEHGAELNIRDKEGKTPLDFATEISLDKVNYPEAAVEALPIIELLASRGAKHATEM